MLVVVVVLLLLLLLSCVLLLSPTEWPAFVWHLQVNFGTGNSGIVGAMAICILTN